MCTVGRALMGEGEGVWIWRSNNGNDLDLEKLPCYDYKKGKHSDLECVVCLESFKMGKNCSHTFHVRCIDSWLLNTPICPICRTSTALPKIALVSADTR